MVLLPVRKSVVCCTTPCWLQSSLFFIIPCYDGGAHLPYLPFAINVVGAKCAVAWSKLGNNRRSNWMVKAIGSPAVIIALIAVSRHRKRRVRACFRAGTRRRYFSPGLRGEESGDALRSAGEAAAHVQVRRARQLVSATSRLPVLLSFIQLVHQWDRSGRRGWLPLQRRRRQPNYLQCQRGRRLWEIPV